MEESNSIEVGISKSKLVKGLIASLAFVAIGIWIIVFTPTVSNSMFNNPLVKYGAAVAAILFFGFAVGYFLYKLSEKKPGLVIDSNGILDNSNAVAIGFIAWADINQFATVTIMNKDFLMIMVHNPEWYIHRQQNMFKRKGMQYNWNNYGSPLIISATSLAISLPELTVLLQAALQQYRSDPAGVEGLQQ